MTDHTMNSAEAALLEAKLEHVMQGMTRQDATLAEVLRAVNVLPVVQSQLSDMKASMAVGSGVMSDHEKRLQAIERDIPALKEIRTWVIAGVLGCLAMIGGAVLKVALIDRPAPPVVTPQENKPQRTMRYMT